MTEMPEMWNQWTKCWVSILMMLFQAFTAAAFPVGCSSVSEKHAPLGWDQETYLAIVEYVFALRNSWVVFAVCFGWLSICSMKQCPIGFTAFVWIWAEGIDPNCFLLATPSDFAMMWMREQATLSHATVCPSFLHYLWAPQNEAVCIKLLIIN